MAEQHILLCSFEDVNTPDDQRTYVDLSDRIISWEVRGGRDSELDDFEATVGRYALNDHDRALDPTNIASPYYPDVVPNRLLWHRILVDSILLYDVFKGYIDGWGPSWDESGFGLHFAQIRATDSKKLLTNYFYTSADPDVVDYEDVLTWDEPTMLFLLNEKSGTKLVRHVRRRKRRKHESKQHFKRHGTKRWRTRETRAEVEGISGSAGSYKNTPTLGEPGPIAGSSNTSVRFTAANSEYALVPIDDNDFATNECTLEAMVKIASLPAASAVIVSLPTTAGNVPAFLTLSSTGHFIMNVTDALGTVSIASTGTYTTGVWYHVVGTFSKSADTITITVDKARDTNSTSTQNLLAVTAGNINIGRFPGGTNYFDGWLANVALYERALSLSRVEAHYDAIPLGFGAAKTGERIVQALKLARPSEYKTLTMNGNEITDALRALRVQGDGRPFQDLEFYGDFEAATTGVATGWDSLETFSAANQFTTVGSPLRVGTKAGKFTVRSGDVVGSGERSEVLMTSGYGTGDVDGDVVFCQGSVRPEGAWTHPSGWEIFHQLHADSRFGQAPIRLQVNGARTHWEWRLVTGPFANSTNALAGTNPGVDLKWNLAKFEADVWFDYRYAMKWTSDSTGWIVVEMKKSTDTSWTRYVEQYGIQTLPTYPSQGAATTIFIKWGLYRNPSAFTNVVYQDGIRLGHSWTDVSYDVPTGTDDDTTGIPTLATNLITNGSFETNTTNWAANGAGASIARITSDSFFGSACLEVTMNGAASSEAAQYAPTLTNGVAYVFQVRVKAAAGQRYRVWVVDNASTTLGTKTFTGDGQWHWHYVLFTATANNTHKLRVGRTATGSTQTLKIDAAQLETGTFPTPYVHTDGATASRSGARVQVPIGSLDETQGWFAARLRMGYDATDVPSSVPYVFRWRDDNNNEIRLRYETATDVFNVFRIAAGSSGAKSSAAQQFRRGDYVTVVAYWTATTLGISVDGSAFLTQANTTIPTLAATTFDVGSSGVGDNYLGGDVVWAAWGTGTLTDADATAMHRSDSWRAAFSDNTQGVLTWNGGDTFASPWNIQKGKRSMPPTRYAGLSAKDIIDDAVAAEGEPALFFVSRQGNSTYLDSTHRDGLTGAPVIGKSSNEIDFETASVADNDAFLYNDIRATGEDNDKTFRAFDQASIDRYGRYTLPLDSLPLADDVSLQAYVDRQLSRYKDPLVRIPLVRLNNGVSTGLSTLLSLELGDCLRVRVPPPGDGGDVIDQVSYVERRSISQSGIRQAIRGDFSISPR